MRIRIMLARLPRLLHSIIEDALSGQPDMEVMPGDGSSTLVAHAEARDVDIVIIGDNDVHTVSALLGARPHMDVIAIVPPARDTLLYEMRPCRVRLGELSPESLVSAVRQANENARSRAAGLLVTSVLEAGGQDQ